MDYLEEKYLYLKKMENRIAFLAEVMPFSSLDKDKELKVVAESFRPKQFKKNDMIFHQEDSSKDLYVICEGKVRIFKSHSHLGETSIEVFVKGNIIGELAVIDDKPRSASAKAISGCILLQITQGDFLNYLEKYHNLAIGMYKLVGQKLRWTATYAGIMARHTSADRFLHLMMLYMERVGSYDPDNDKKWILDFGLKQEDLASLAGMERRTLLANLVKWEESGLLKFDKKTKKVILFNAPELVRKLKQDNYYGDLLK